MDVLAGTDFFTVEVLTWRGLVTYYVLLFVELESRRVWIGGITRHPDACWMQQVAHNATLEDMGYLKGIFWSHGVMRARPQQENLRADRRSRAVQIVRKGQLLGITSK
jgi:hypothetical protein